MKIGKINCISIAKNAYVSRLEAVASPPLNLYSIGSLPDKRRPTVAIIGSRTPTPYGEEVTRHFASFLAKNGVVIVSGLAYGIDSIAHRAAVKAGGTTIAVLAGGLHAIYPAAHSDLARSIVRSGGALISEHPAGHEARKYDFLGRNRLISGLADAVLVPEATIRSGSLSTISHAREQDRDVFIIPGPITSPLSAGTNSALQEGCLVALRPEDILERIAPGWARHRTKGAQQQLPLGDTPLEQQIIQALSAGALPRDAFYDHTNASTQEVLTALTMLELKGVVHPHGGDVWSLERP